jgi:hypothetical protein
MQLVGYFLGLFVLIFVFWPMYRFVTGSWNVLKFVVGDDGRPSTSKLQWFLWTVVIIFSYIAVYSTRVWYGNSATITEIPQNLLIAMGLSVTTMVAAKGITASYVASGQVVKPELSNTQKEKVGLGPILQNDDGTPDLSKSQIMAWTLIGIGIYIIHLLQQVHTASVNADIAFAANVAANATAAHIDAAAAIGELQMPDIDAVLMVLMGLGQGAYLGKKLVTTTTPRFTGISPGSGPGKTDVIITGMSFGESQNGSLITLDGNPITLDKTTLLLWGDNQIKFRIPGNQPIGKIDIGVIVNGRSTNTLPFAVTAT